MSETAIVQVHKPTRGDLVIVERSDWYAMESGEWGQLCEQSWWQQENGVGLMIPRKGLSGGRAFWGKQHATADGPEYMSTSGGPFVGVPLVDLVFVRRELNTFWRWQDYPRSDGGENYQREVSVWRLPHLRDKHRERVEAAKKAR